MESLLTGKLAGLSQSSWREIAYLSPIIVPMSLIYISYKLLEHILYSHIMTHQTTTTILFKQQHGFRKNPSCGTQFSDFIDGLHTNPDCCAQMEAVLLGFSKSFQWCFSSSTTLWTCIPSSWPIHFFMHAWLFSTSFLSSCVQYTVINDPNFA